MKLRSLIALAALLLLPACSLQMPSYLPGQPTAIPASSSTPTPASPTSALERHSSLAPVASATPAPSQTVTPERTPTPAATVTPAPISADNASRIRPVIIYPLFRHGLLHHVWWTPDSGSLVVETSLGLQVLSVPDLHKRFSLPDTTALYFLQNGELLVMKDGELSLLDPANGGVRQLPIQPASTENGLPIFAISGSQKLWATSPGDNTLELTSLGGGAVSTVSLSSRTNIALRIEAIFFSPDDTRLFAYTRRVDNETELIAVDTAAGQQLYETFNADSHPAFSLDGLHMVYDHGDHIWMDKVADGKNWNSLARRIVKKSSQNQQNILNAVGISFLSGSNNIGVIYNGTISDTRTQEDKFIPSTLMIYNAENGKVERFINNLPHRVTAFAFSPDARLFFTTSQDGVLRLFQTADGLPLQASQPFDVDPHPALLFDGSLVAYAQEDHITLVDPSTEQVQANLGSYPGAIHLQARFVGSDKLAIFVETNWRKFIDLYEIPSRKFLFRYPELSDCNFNRAGNLMICSGPVVKYFDMPSGQSLLDLVPQGSGMEYASSENGQRVASCTPGSAFIYIWEVRLGSIPKYTLSAETDQAAKTDICGKLAFTPTGDRLASASGYFWDIPSGKLLAQFTPAEATSGPAAISPAGDLLLAYPNWVDLNSGKVLGTLQTVPDLSEIFFQPDSLNLILRSRRGVEFWNIGE